MLRCAVCVALALLAIGCGEDDQAEATPEPTAEPAVEAAGSAQECFELWNEHEELGTAGQTAPADILADLAPTPVFVEFHAGECHVIAPIRKGSKRAYVWVARGGQAPYGQSVPQDVPPLEFNARGLKNGKLEPAA